MSAEVLRVAATIMRARAEGALLEPWRNDFGRVTADVAGYGIAAVCDPVRKSDAAHIASWHPAVALAVADWLDSEADLHDALITHGGRGLRPDGQTPGAFAVAAAYLGTQP